MHSRGGSSKTPSAINTTNKKKLNSSTHTHFSTKSTLVNNKPSKSPLTTSTARKISTTTRRGQRELHNTLRNDAGGPIHGNKATIVTLTQKGKDVQNAQNAQNGLNSFKNAKKSPKMKKMSPSPLSSQVASMTTTPIGPIMSQQGAFGTLGGLNGLNNNSRGTFRMMHHQSRLEQQSFSPPSSISPTHSSLPSLKLSPGRLGEGFAPTKTPSNNRNQHTTRLKQKKISLEVDPSSTPSLSPHTNHHTRLPGFNPDDIRQRAQQRLAKDIETTMPQFKKQLNSFTEQLMSKYSKNAQNGTNPIPPSPQVFNTNGSMNSASNNAIGMTGRRGMRTKIDKKHSNFLQQKLKRAKNSNNSPKDLKTHQRMTSSSTRSMSSTTNDFDQYETQKKTAFQRLLPHINKISQVLTPKVKRLMALVKSGTVTLTKPMIDLISAHIVPPISNTIDKVGEKGEGLLLWVDRQIAKRKDIPVDQISAIRTQIIAISANSIVAVSKAVAAYFSNSGVMLAEALHSLADLSNQALLLFGTTKALRHSDDVHPYGYATAKYIYGVLSASGVFFISCALTMYHAITQFFDDTHVVAVTPLTVIVLGVSLIVEGYSQYAAYKSIKELAAKDDMTFMEYIRGGKETTSIAIFVEDSVAIIGLTIAIVTTALTHIFQNNIYDTIGTGCIGLAMGFVAYFLFHRNESYVLGTSFTTEEKGELLQALKTRDAVTAVHDLKAVAYGGSDCRVKAEVVFDGQIIAKQVLDQTKLIPVSVLFKENQDDNDPVTQSMLIGPDGTLAGNQILHHLTKYAGLSTEDATQLLLRFGGECVSEVARETDQVEKYTKALFPEVTHLDLECHSSNPLEDFSSEHFVYPYLAKHRKSKEMVASAKRAKKSRAWTNFAKTNFQSLQQAMRGEHDLFIQQQAQQQQMAKAQQSNNNNNNSQNNDNLDQNDQNDPNTTSSTIDSNSPSPTSPSTSTNPHQVTRPQTTPQPTQYPPEHKHTSIIGAASTPSSHQQQHHPRPPIHLVTPQSPSTPHPSHSDALNELTRDLNLNNSLPTKSTFHNQSDNPHDNSSNGGRLRTGRYDKPIHAKELVRDDVYKEALSSYRNMFGEIDSSMTLFPVEAYNHLHMNTGKPTQPAVTSPIMAEGNNTATVM